MLCLLAHRGVQVFTSHVFKHVMRGWCSYAWCGGFALLVDPLRYSGIQVFRYSGIQVSRYPGILDHVSRYSGATVSTHSGLQAFRRMARGWW
jgi:hypothetical protein